ncbi:6510_t:CDS:2, partial [Funneliformis mosseae]
NKKDTRINDTLNIEIELDNEEVIVLNKKIDYVVSNEGIDDELSNKGIDYKKELSEDELFNKGSYEELFNNSGDDDENFSEDELSDVIHEVIEVEKNVVEEKKNIEALSKVINMLVKKVHILKASSSTSYQPEKKILSVQSMLLRYVLIFPEPKDEVVQILNGLDNSLQLDHTKKWIEIAGNISKHIIKVINKVMEGRFWYKDVELK